MSICPHNSHLVFLSCLALAVSSIPVYSTGIQLSGDPAFDSDSIRNADANQWRWLAFPGGRLSLNPVPGKDLAPPETKWNIPPLGEKLPLDIGAFAGTKAVRLMNLATIGLAKDGGSTELSTTRSTAWFPHKLTFDASFPGNARITGTDFFTDAKDGIVRSLDVAGAKGKILRLGGQAPKEASLKWEPASGVLLLSHPKYFCALRFATGSGPDQPLTPAAKTPKVEGGNWELDLPVGSDREHFAIGVGFSSTVEGEAKAAERAKSGFTPSIAESLSKAKTVFDGYLRKVPVPAKWGVRDATGEITAEQHRRAYYAAWAFIISNLMDVLPESPEYPYPQLAVGKASLWDEGEATSPATCGWESFFAYQWFSFVDAELAWQAYMGLMTRVDEEGVLGGESLPSRKAQTAWLLHQRKPDLARLREVYPALKRYLLWRENNPRWVYGTNLAKDEKDIEFAVSWLFDVDYMILVANELGMTGETATWKQKKSAMVKNMRQWFYSNPNKIEQFYFADSGVHTTKTRFENVPMMITTALCLEDLPADLRERTRAYFLALFDPKKKLAGFPSGKHPDLNLTAYGLLEMGMPEAKPFVETWLASAIRAGEFAEVLEVKSPTVADGVKPSLFSPLNIIEFTWLLNNVRYDSGTPTAFTFPPIETGKLTYD